MGVTLNGIVAPAKAGFLVEMWWETPGLEPVKGAWETTDPMGRVQFTPSATSWPVTFYLVIPKGQVVDGVEYGGYTSDKATLYDTQEADFHLYPTAPLKPLWALASAALGIALIMLGCPR
ncbi:unnamed protein product [marine sediment metagenome]|uniref:Uncharacterized protein n=1 Tax=marine sediment metagenome TaxID=412755 RepID=X1IG73_9ZZZZ